MWVRNGLLLNLSFCLVNSSIAHARLLLHASCKTLLASDSVLAQLPPFWMEHSVVVEYGLVLSDFLGELHV